MALPDGRKFKVKLEIQDTFIDTNNLNLILRLTTANLPAGMYTTGSQAALNGGGDIALSSDEAGTDRLYLNIEEFTLDGNVDMWVRRNNCQSASVTDIWAWWGKVGESQPAASASGGSEGVPSSANIGSGSNTGSQCMLHLEESGSPYNDVSEDGNDGTSTDAPAQQSAIIKNGQKFVASSDQHIRLASDATLNDTKFTLEYLWFNNTNTENFGRIYSRVSNNFEIAQRGTAPSLDYRIDFYNGTGWTNTTYAAPVDTWEHHLWSYDDTTLKFYVNGVEKHSSSETLTGSNGPFTLGARESSEVESPDGYLDEFRFMDGEVDANYAKASFNAIFNPGSMIIEGAIETIGGLLEREYPRGVNRGVTRGVI